MRDKFLSRILLRCGAYYQSGELFYQRLWRDRLRAVGFRILLVRKLAIHDVWELRVCGSLTSQTYLLMSKPVPRKLLWSKDLLTKQLQAEIHLIAQDLGLPIKRDCITVTKTGAYFRAAFIWKKGKPGMLLKQGSNPEAFSFIIKPWLKRNRN